ncbi:tetratricopeptide repeat protein [Marinoscillum furvescens]|uniref:Tfp pilus assembly protein PilF n=1 Tax=Marinoscillum furvescens DSM 4134 TaxID=1122208 RepID=A0A3D9LIY4_MARFU|nr:tetratricopeptide repeat protein [Marinoscillum furvescens]REE05989.1 Tfp pilus assembly protein PilF [Marinoscillum furvescens DSM 4134]
MRIACLVILLLFASLAEAQRKKSKKEKFEPLDVTELSESDALKLEMILIDAEREHILENYYKALELFKEALEIDPSNAVVNFKIAEILTKNGDSQLALPYATKAMQLDGGNKYYLLLAAEVQKSLSNYEEAARIYQQMIDHIPGTETYLFDLAIIYQYQGQNEKALATYRRAEEVFGMNEMVLREKQKIYLKDKDFDALIADWDKLIGENPGQDRYIIELCEFLIANNRLEEAKERLQTLNNSKHADLLLSEIALLEGDTPRAINLAMSTFDSPKVDYKAKLSVLNNFLDYVVTPEEFAAITELTKKMVSQYPEQYEVLAFSGDVMFRLEQKEEARDYYLRAVSIDPGNFGVWQNILNLEASLNQYDSVIVHAETALEYFPNQAALYYFAGTGYLIKKDYRKSVQILDQGKRFATEPGLLTIFYGQMGDAYNSMKQYEKSYAAYEQALKANPDNDHVLNNYSYFLSLREEKMEKALAMSTRLVEAHPENPTYLDTHGWVLYTLGKFEEALVYLRKAANMQEDGTVIEHYGDVLFQLGKIDEAVAQWKRALQTNEASKQIEKKIADRKLYE